MNLKHMLNNPKATMAVVNIQYSDTSIKRTKKKVNDAGMVPPRFKSFFLKFGVSSYYFSVHIDKTRRGILGLFWAAQDSVKLSRCFPT